MREYKKYIILFVGIVLVMVGCSVLWNKYEKAKKERDIYLKNNEVLLSDIEHYKTKSGLDAVRVGELEFKVKELEKYRADDISLIKDLGIKKRELEQLTKMQQQTIYQLEGVARDTVFIQVKDDTPKEIAAKCIEHSDEWLDFECCIYDDNSYEAEIKSRDKITYIEEVKYKRALGFLWRTKRVKSRKQIIVNQNPNAEIVEAEFITIRK